MGINHILIDMAAAGGLWPRKDEFLRLKEHRQTLVLLSDVEIGKEYYIMFGYNANPLFSFKRSLATYVRDLPNNEKEFVGDIIDGDGNIFGLGVTFSINSGGHETIFTWPPPNEGTGGTKQLHRHAVWNGSTGSTASRKKSRKLKRKNHKSRKNRR